MGPIRFENAALILLVLSAGCTTVAVSRSPHAIDPAEVQKLVVGKTTKAQVLAAFGPPACVTLNAKGLETYTFVSGSVLSQTWYVPPVLVVYANSATASKISVLSVTFNADAVADWSYSVNSGTSPGAAQPGGGRFE